MPRILKPEFKTLFKKTACTLALGGLLLASFAGQAEAHAYSASYSALDMTKDSINLTFSIDELSVLELSDGDLNGDGKLQQTEFKAAEDSLLTLFKENLELQMDQNKVNWNKVDRFELEGQPGSGKAVLQVSYPAASASQTISFTDHLYVDWADKTTNYVDLLTISFGQKKNTAALSGEYRNWSMQLKDSDYAALAQNEQDQQKLNQTNGNSAEDNSSSEALSGWYSFFKLGMNHILTGYDHLLFLFSLLIARQKFKQYAGMITAFTVAHSITLTLTVLGIINVPGWFVEPAIALSICYVALDNIFRKEVSYRWVLTFLFGLIHGMGFADILKVMNLPKSSLAVDLISFNLGIETIQITLVALLLPLLALMHRWKFSRNAIIGASALAFLMGGAWLVERVFL